MTPRRLWRGGEFIPPAVAAIGGCHHEETRLLLGHAFGLVAVMDDVVCMNQTHPAQVRLSWYGDSVGRHEGDTLVIDTVVIKVGRFSMLD